MRIQSTSIVWGNVAGLGVPPNWPTSSESTGACGVVSGQAENCLRLNVCSVTPSTVNVTELGVQVLPKTWKAPHQLELYTDHELYWRSNGRPVPWIACRTYCPPEPDGPPFHGSVMISPESISPLASVDGSCEAYCQKP